MYLFSVVLVCWFVCLSVRCPANYLRACLTTMFLSYVPNAFVKKYFLSRTLESFSKSGENLPIRWPDCVHVQSLCHSRRPSIVHVPPSQRSYCVLQRYPAILPSSSTTFSRPSSVHVQSSAFLYRPSSVRLTTTSQGWKGGKHFLWIVDRRRTTDDGR